MLHAGIKPPGADRLVERIIHHRAEHLAIAGTEALNGFRVETQLADRSQQESLQTACASLGQGIELTDRLDLVAKEIDPQRRG